MIQKVELNMYVLDHKLKLGSHKILDLGLSEVRLKDNQYFPWVILIPRITYPATEIFELYNEDQQKLLEEISQVSRNMNTYFKPDKINIGALGNIVSQLHIHVVARFKTDLAWPHSVWQPNIAEKIYDPKVCEIHIGNLRKLLSNPQIK